MSTRGAERVLWGIDMCVGGERSCSQMVPSCRRTGASERERERLRIKHSAQEAGKHSEIKLRLVGFREVRHKEWVRTRKQSLDDQGDRDDNASKRSEGKSCLVLPSG